MVEIGRLSFFGEQEHRVDPQGRISLPTRFRDAFKGGIVLTRGYDPCIVAWTPSDWDIFAGQVASLPLNKVKNRRIRRLSFSAARPLETDRQGRVLLPVSLRHYAGINIGEEVVIAGMGDFLEIWANAAWIAESTFLDQEGQILAETSEEHA